MTVYKIPIVWVDKIGDGVAATERSPVFYRETTAFNRGPSSLLDRFVKLSLLSIDTKAYIFLIYMETNRIYAYM